MVSLKSKMFSKVTTVRHCTLLGCYAAYNGSPVPMFRDTPSIPSSRFKQSKKNASFFYCFTLEDETDRLSRNVAAELPLYAA